MVTALITAIQQRNTDETVFLGSKLLLEEQTSYQLLRHDIKQKYESNQQNLGIFSQHHEPTRWCPSDKVDLTHKSDSVGTEEFFKPRVVTSFGQHRRYHALCRGPFGQIISMRNYCLIKKY